MFPQATSNVAATSGSADLPAIAGASNFTKANNAVIIAAMTAMKAGTRDAKIAIFGDSTTWGYQSSGLNSFTNNRIDSPVYQLATKLTAAAIPSSADSFWGLGDLANPPVTLANFLLADPRMAVSGAGWVASGGIQSAGWSVLQNTTSTVDTFTFTPNSTVNRMDLAYVRASGTSGSLTYKIDGGADQAAINMGIGGADGIGRTSALALGTVASHAVQFRLTATNGYIAGVNFYDSTTRKVQIWNWGNNGAAPGDWLAHSINPWDITNTYFTFGQDLVIINCVENPMGTLPDPTSTMADIQTLITHFKANSSDVWLVMPQPISDEAIIQPAYKTALHNLANTNSCTFIDLQAVGAAPWCAVAANLTTWKAASFWTDDKHPNVAGYGENARRYQQLVAAIYAAG